jgi:N-acetylmuramoyl-L-alanine amidase
MAKLELLMLHATATPEGRKVTSNDILQWHIGPLHGPDGTVIYKGKTYGSAKDLPDEMVGGVHISKLKGRGWKEVGYSDMILLDGTVVNLVPYNDDNTVDPWEITNGATGVNAKTRHVVYVGGTDKNLKAKDTRTPEQLKALEDYVWKFLRNHPTVKVCGHNQFNPSKDCPSFDCPTWLQSIGIPTSNIYRK